MARFLLDFTRSTRANESAVELPDGDVEYQLRGRDQVRPDVADLRWSAALRERLEALRAHTTEGVGEAAARLGRTLADFVTVPGQAAALQAMAAAGHAEASSLTIRANAAEIYLLPWELLTLGDVTHLGSLEQLAVRYEWPDSRTAAPPPGLSRTRRGRVVFAWSAAGGKVDAAWHARLLEDALGAARGLFEPAADLALDVLPNASGAAVRDALERARAAGEPVAALHLLCHGGSDAEGTFGLALDAEGGGARDLAGPSRLQQLLAPYAGLVRLVVISACDGGNAGPVGHELGSVAQSLHRAGFAAVVASRFPLSWDGARAFAESLYRALLGELRPVEDGLLAARRSLAAQATYDWASLQLYAREADGGATFPFQARPYRGLEAFSPDQSRFFFGRDAQVDELVADLDALVAAGRPRLLVVSGASGTGKSSMVLAGAVPKLRARLGDARFAWAVVRPGGGFDAALRAADEALAAAAGRERLLLVVDQFEEVFTHGDRGAAEGFVRALWARARAPSSPLCVLATLRLDFLARCGELVLDDEGLRFDQVACDPTHQVLVPQMTPAQLREAIEAPARSAGLALEPNLAELIVRDVEAEPGALPLMSHALSLLWQRRESPTLTRAAYERLGRVAGALDAHADACLAALADDAAREAARRLLLRLVHVGIAGAPDTRRRQAVDDLRPRDPAAGLRFERVLAALVGQRLLVTGEQTGARQTVEVAHEALIRTWQRLRGWIDQERASLARLAELEGWVRDWRRSPDALLAGARLAAAEELAAKHGEELDADALRLVAESRAAQDARVQSEEASRRFRRYATRGGFAAMAAFLAVVVGLLVQAKRAERVAEQREGDARIAEARAQGESRRAALGELRSTAATLRGRAEAPGFELINLADAIELRARAEVAGHRPVPPAVDGALLQAVTAATLRLPLVGHEGAVLTAAFSPDGRRVVSASMDGRAIVWDVQTGRRVATLAGHQGAVARAAYSADGTRIVTASADGTARLWDAREGGAIATLPAHPGAVRFAGFSPDGTVVVTTGDGGAARLWDGRTGAPLRALEGHAGEVNAATFSRTGEGLATGGGDGKVRLWEVATGALRATYDAPGAVTSLAFSPEDSLLAATTAEGAARHWRMADGRVAFEQPPAMAMASVFSDDGRLWLAGGVDGIVRTFDLHTAAVVAPFTGHLGPVRALARSPDGQRVLAAGDDLTARLWSVRGVQALETFEGHANVVVDARFSPDGRTVATASEDGVVRLWGERAGGFGARFEGHDADVTRGAWSSDGARALTASLDGTARLWNAATGALLQTIRHEGLAAAALSRDGATAVTASPDGRVGVWDAATGALRHTLTDAPAELPRVALSPRDTCAFVLHGSDVVAWDVASGRRAATFHTPGARATSLALSSDGARLAVGLSNGAVTVRDAPRCANPPDNDRGPLDDVRGDRFARVNAVAFSPDGARVAAAGLDGVLSLWDARTGARLGRFVSTQPLADVAFSPDGSLLVAVGLDPRVVVVDGRSATPQGGLRLIRFLRGHRAAVLSARFSPDGGRLLTASFDRTAAYWDVVDGTLLTRLVGHTRALSWAGFSPDGRHALTTSEDGSARRWDLDPARALRAACDLLQDGSHWRDNERVRDACGGPRTLPPAAVGAMAGPAAPAARADADTVAAVPLQPVDPSMPVATQRDPVGAVSAVPEGRRHRRRHE